MIRILSVFFLVILSAMSCAACSSSGSRGQAATVQTEQVTEVRKDRPTRDLHSKQLWEEEKVLAAAQAYMNKQGLKVGRGQGEMVLSVENLWEEKATVIYGFADSEFFAELGMRKSGDQWKIVYDQARYFVYDDIKDPLTVIARAEGIEFGEEPGKHLAGLKERLPQQLVLLSAPYGERWVWEYTLGKKQDSWVILAKNKANEHWKPAP